MREPNKPTIIAVTSGKGGVGKTMTTINFAVSARKNGKTVLILDGDMGLANVDIMLGLQPELTILDVLSGNAKLEDTIISGPLGIDLIPSGSGISQLANLSPVQKQALLTAISELERHYDVLIVDTGAGIHDQVMQFCQASDMTVVVTTPEPHALTDAYATIKVLNEEYGVKGVSLLVNQTKSPKEGVKIFEKIAEVAERFLKVHLTYLGSVPEDEAVSRGVMQRSVATKHTTSTLSGQAWSQAASILLHNLRSGRKDIQEFLYCLVGSESTSPTNLNL